MRYKQGGGEQSERKQIEPGVYTLRCDKAQEKVFASGNEGFKLECAILDPATGEDAATTFENLVFTEKAFWKVDEALAAFGHSVVEGQEVEVTPDMLEGRKARAKIVMEASPTNGKLYPRVETWLRAETPTEELPKFQQPRGDDNIPF